MKAIVYSICLGMTGCATLVGDPTNDAGTNPYCYQTSTMFFCDGACFDLATGMEVNCQGSSSGNPSGGSATTTISSGTSSSGTQPTPSPIPAPTSTATPNVVLIPQWNDGNYPLIPLATAEQYDTCDAYCTSVGKTCNANICVQGNSYPSAFIFDCAYAADLTDSENGALTDGGTTNDPIGSGWTTCSTSITYVFTNTVSVAYDGDQCSFIYDSNGNVTGYVYPAYVQCCCN